MITRLETGPYKPDPDDWTGVFIRGDDAFMYALALRDLLDGNGNFITKHTLMALYELLCSCAEDDELRTTMLERKDLDTTSPASD